MASPLHILKVSAGMPPLRHGGVPAYVEDLRHGLRRRGHRVSYLDTTPRDSADPRPRIEVTSPADDSHGFYNTGATVPFIAPSPSPLSDIRASAEATDAFAGFLGRIRPDILHFHELLGFPLSLVDTARRLRIPTVFTSQDYFPLCPTIQLYRQGESCCRRRAEELVCARCMREQNWDRFSDPGRPAPHLRRFLRSNRLSFALAPLANSMHRSIVEMLGSDERRYRRRRRLVNAYLSRLDVIVSMSRRHCELVQELGGPLSNLRQMYLSRTSYRFGQATAEHWPAKDGSLRFLAMNVNSPAKGRDLLLSEFRRFVRDYPACELHLYGGAAAPSEGTIHFHGRYRADQLDSIAASFDAAIIPSIWEEAYAYVGPELLSRGLPVIASSHGAMKEYVRDGENGLVFDPDLPGSLVAALMKLTSDQGLRQRLTTGSRTPNEAIQDFQAHLTQVEALYRELL